MFVAGYGSTTIHPRLCNSAASSASEIPASDLVPDPLEMGRAAELDLGCGVAAFGLGVAAFGCDVAALGRAFSYIGSTTAGGPSPCTHLFAGRRRS